MAAIPANASCLEVANSAWPDASGLSDTDPSTGSTKGTIRAASARSSFCPTALPRRAAAAVGSVEAIEALLAAGLSPAGASGQNERRMDS